MTEVWFRDPISYMNECAQLLVPHIIWEGRLLDQKAIDAQAQIEMHYPQTAEYRILIVRDNSTTVELRRGFSPAMPFAVYQTWAYDQDTIDDLEDMLANPPGEDMALCSNPSVAADRRPVYGQEHRVMVTRYPDATGTLGRSFLRALQRFQKDYPEVIIHLWGSTSFRACFGMGFAAADIEPWTEARHGTLYLPSGRRINYEQGVQFAQWIRMLGFSQNELSTVSKRIQFNIKSAQWAGENFETNLKFKTNGHDPVDPNSHHHLPATAVNVMSQQIKAGEGDKITCDTCSLFAACKYYRDGAVCSLPDTDGAKLAGFFGTRSADSIIEGLGKVLATQANRFERGAQDEEYSQDGLDPNLTRLGHVLVQDGEKLAKLIDPRLAAAGAARVTAFYGGQHIHTDTPNSLVASVVHELEQRGIARDDITTEMVEEYVMQEHSRQAIDVRSRP